MLLLLRFGLMIFFPGTPTTGMLFQAVLPFWHAFSSLCKILALPGTITLTILAKLLPPTTSQYLPASDALPLIQAYVSDSATLVDYPGVLEWGSLVSIAIWWFIALALSYSIHTFTTGSKDINYARIGKNSQLFLGTVIRSIGSMFDSDDGDDINSKTSPKKPRTANKQTDEFKEKALQKTNDNEILKSRLKKHSAKEIRIPKQLPPQEKSEQQRESLESFRAREGEIAYNQLVRDLREENQNLQAQQNELRSTFSQYFSPQVLQYLESNKSNFENLQNQSFAISVLFCDIRNFTELTQSTPPQELQALLNNYFSLSLNVILNIYNGSINKLMGDGVLAYWGFPIPNENHAAYAVQAAVDVHKAIDDFNTANPDKPPLSIGIGIATGTAIIGNVGSNDFKDFTLIGTPVNLAARLDDLNKSINTSILIDEATHTATAHIIPSQKQGDFDIKGWNEPVSVYGLNLD